MVNNALLGIGAVALVGCSTSVAPSLPDPPTAPQAKVAAQTNSTPAPANQSRLPSAAKLGDGNGTPLPQETFSSIEERKAGEGPVLINDWNDRRWQAGEKGIATRMVNAPTSPEHVARYVAVTRVTSGIAKNTADMLNNGSLRKVLRGATVTLVRIDSNHTYPYVECTVEHDGQRYSVYLVLEKNREGHLSFVRSNDCILEPDSKTPD